MALYSAMNCFFQQIYSLTNSNFQHAPYRVYEVIEHTRLPVQPVDDWLQSYLPSGEGDNSITLCYLHHQFH